MAIDVFREYCTFYATLFIFGAKRSVTISVANLEAIKRLKWLPLERDR